MARGGRLQQLFSDERFQLGYGLGLMVLIPSGIILFTVLTIVRYSQTIDITLQRQALVVGRVFGAAVGPTAVIPAEFQSRIVRVGRANPDILGLQLLTPSGTDAFTVVASLQAEEIGATIAAPYYSLAWQQSEGEGLATDFLGAINPAGQVPAALQRQGERFWLVSLPLFAASAGTEKSERMALLTLQLSSAIVDRQAEASWRAAVVGLTVTVLLTVLFLAAATRLWGYARLYRKIREVDRMKDEFISLASHELRTPITAVQAYLEMVLAGDYGKLSPKVHYGLQRAKDSAQRLNELVEDLLKVSRIEQGRISLELTPLDLTAITREVVEQLLPTATAKELQLNLRAEVAALPVVADADRLKQVLMNIVGNAIKYTPRGQVDVTVRRDEDAETWGVVRVKDTGVGISAADQARLFTKFYRAKTDATQKILGTGLGLWITKQLVELMRGKLYLESIEGTGTQVTVVLPAAKPAMPAPSEKKV